MMKYLAPVTLTLVLAGTCLAGSTTLPVSRGISFQNPEDQGTLEADHTALMLSKDEVWAPLPGGTVTADYYATGTWKGYWDAASLNFDLTSIVDPIISLDLRFYLQKGMYAPEWHHYMVLEGEKNPEHQDNYPTNPWIPFDGKSFGSADDQWNQWEVWITEPIDLSWVSGSALDVTLRLWNARLDVVLLDVVTEDPVPPPPPGIPAPGAILLGSLGAGLVGWLRRRCAI